MPVPKGKQKAKGAGDASARPHKYLVQSTNFSTKEHTCLPAFEVEVTAGKHRRAEPGQSTSRDTGSQVTGDANAAVGGPAIDIPMSQPVTAKSAEPRPSTSRQTRSQAKDTGVDDFMANIQAEEPHPSTARHDPMQPVVRLEACAEAIKQARKLIKEKKRAPPTTFSKPYHSDKDRSKTVDAAQEYGFIIRNRCNNAANPMTFCPYCLTWWANSDHFYTHADVIDEKKLRAYCKGVFKGGLRGPLYRQDVIDSIHKWIEAGTLRDSISQLFAVVGVGITDSKDASMPLYDLQHCFKRNTHPSSMLLHRAPENSDEEMYDDS